VVECSEIIQEFLKIYAKSFRLGTASLLNEDLFRVSLKSLFLLSYTRAIIDQVIGGLALW